MLDQPFRKMIEIISGFVPMVVHLKMMDGVTTKIGSNELSCHKILCRPDRKEASDMYVTVSVRMSGICYEASHCLYGQDITLMLRTNSAYQGKFITEKLCKSNARNGHSGLTRCH